MNDQKFKQRKNREYIVSIILIWQEKNEKILNHNYWEHYTAGKNKHANRGIQV